MSNDTSKTNALALCCLVLSDEYFSAKTYVLDAFTDFYQFSIESDLVVRIFHDLRAHVYCDEKATKKSIAILTQLLSDNASEVHWVFLGKTNETQKKHPAYKTIMFSIENDVVQNPNAAYSIEHYRYSKLMSAACALLYKMHDCGIKVTQMRAEQLYFKISVDLTIEICMTSTDASCCVLQTRPFSESEQYQTLRLLRYLLPANTQWHVLEEHADLFPKASQAKWLDDKVCLDQAEIVPNYGYAKDFNTYYAKVFLEETFGHLSTNIWNALRVADNFKWPAGVAERYLKLAYAQPIEVSVL